MDERLEAGRHHLDNGIRALRQGYLDEGRSHFEAALLQFRSPELRIGEAHALRGLGEVELHGGNLAGAESVTRAAIREYQEVRNQLDRVDPSRVSIELHRDSEESEAAAHTLLGEILIRGGKTEEARHELAYAHQLYSTLGEEVASAAGVYMNLARLGMREGKSADARASVDKAIDLLGRCGETAGQAGAWLLAAEVERLNGRLPEADEALGHAMRLADETRQVTMQGRARSQQASLLAQQGRFEEAVAAYDDALGRIRDAADVEMEAYALLGRGDVRSRLRDPGSLFDLVEGTRLLAQLEHRHGLGTAMLRLSEHAVRQELPVYALAAAESARQFWQVADPKRGLGHALRMQVKALTMLRKWPAVITAAHARAAIAGDLQPHAILVRDFYRQRSPQALLADLDKLDATQLELRTESMVEALLDPMLQQLDLDFQSLGVPGGALAITSAFASATPSTAALRPGPTPVAIAKSGPRTIVPDDDEPAPAASVRMDTSNRSDDDLSDDTFPEELSDPMQPTALPEEYGGVYTPPKRET